MSRLRDRDTRSESPDYNISGLHDNSIIFSFLLRCDTCQTYNHLVA